MRLDQVLLSIITTIITYIITTFIASWIQSKKPANVWLSGKRKELIKFLSRVINLLESESIRLHKDAFYKVWEVNGKQKDQSILVGNFFFEIILKNDEWYQELVKAGVVGGPENFRNLLQFLDTGGSIYFTLDRLKVILNNLKKHVFDNEICIAAKQV